MTYTILPPGPVDPTVRFDLHQWHKPSRAMTRKSMLAGSDYIGHMHMETHRGHRRLYEFGPTFANNDKQLRHVLAESVWRATHSKWHPLPTELINNLPALVKMIEAKTTKMRAGLSHINWNRKILGRYLWNHEQAGGYLHFRARLMYLSWHLGYTSVEVAQEMGTTPWNVRIVLYRLCHTAEALGYETFKHRRGVKIQPLRVQRNSSLTKLPPGPQLLEIYDVFGVAQQELADRFAVKLETVRYALQKARKLEDPNHKPLRKGPRRWVKLERVGNKIIGRSTRGPK